MVFGQCEVTLHFHSAEFAVFRIAEQKPASSQITDY